MRGSLTVNDSYDLATEDIELMNDLVKENMEMYIRVNKKAT